MHSIMKSIIKTNGIKCNRPYEGALETSTLIKQNYI